MIKKYSLIYFVLISIGFVSCSKDDILRYQSFEKLKSSLKHNELVAWSVDLPSGSIVSQSEKKVEIKLPEEVELMVFSAKNNRFEPLLSTDYTCTCETKDGTCKPFVAGDRIGCVTDKNQSCTQCIGKRSVINGIPEYSVAYYTHKISNSDIGLLDGFAAVQTIPNPNLLSTLPPVTQDILDNTKIDSLLREIVSKYNYPAHLNFRLNKIPEGYSLVPIAIKEHLAYIIIPKDQVESGMIEIAPIMKNAEEEINCVGCSGKCKLKSAKLGQIKYCDGCDSGCTIRNYEP